MSGKEALGLGAVLDSLHQSNDEVVAGRTPPGWKIADKTDVV